MAIGRRSQLFNNGSVQLLRRARAAPREEIRQAVLIIEGPTLLRLFKYVDGSLDWGIDTLVRRLCVGRAGTNGHESPAAFRSTTGTRSSRSAQAWLRVSVLENASQILRARISRGNLRGNLPEKQVDLGHVAHQAFWGLHAWRNAGLILGLSMPGLDDLIPRNWQQMENVPNPFQHMTSSKEVFRHALEGLRPRAAAIDEAFSGRNAPAPRTMSGNY